MSLLEQLWRRLVDDDARRQQETQPLIVDPKTFAALTKYLKEEHMGPKNYQGPFLPMQPDTMPRLGYYGSGAETKAYDAPSLPQQGPSPWTKHRSAWFDGCHVDILCDESGKLQRLMLSGQLVEQAHLKALIGFLQELVR